MTYLSWQDHNDFLWMDNYLKQFSYFTAGPDSRHAYHLSLKNIWQLQRDIFDSWSQKSRLTTIQIFFWHICANNKKFAKLLRLKWTLDMALYREKWNEELWCSVTILYGYISWRDIGVYLQTLGHIDNLSLLIHNHSSLVCVSALFNQTTILISGCEGCRRLWQNNYHRWSYLDLDPVTRQLSSGTLLGLCGSK